MLTNRQTLLDLADRCEAATGGDRELDAEIALALGIVRERDGDCFYGHRDYSVMVLERCYYDHDGNAPELPAFTASLDAAMGLVAEGWQYCLMDQNGYPEATLRNDRIQRVAWSHGANLALALTAASLRARAAMEGGDDR